MEDGLWPEEFYTHPHGCIKLILLLLVKMLTENLRGDLAYHDNILLHMLAEAGYERLDHLKVCILTQIVVNWSECDKPFELGQFVVQKD